MPKRGSDADSRIFFDELVSLAAPRLKATGVIRLEDRHGVIAFDEKQKLVGVAHTIFKNGGSWSFFVCPRCGGRKKKLWLVDDAPRCLSCCWSLGVRYRSAYGFGRGERLRERDCYVDRVQDRRLRGRRRRLTGTMRRSMIVCRLAQFAYLQKAKDGSGKPLPFMRAYQPRKAAIEAIPDLKRLWKAQTAEPSNKPWIKRKRLSYRSSSIRRHASSNNRRKPHVENTRSTPNAAGLEASIALHSDAGAILPLTFCSSKAGATFHIAIVSRADA
jgi:hypothetical protein